MNPIIQNEFKQVFEQQVYWNSPENHCCASAQKFDVITVAIVGIGLVVFIIAGLIFLKLRNRSK